MSKRKSILRNIEKKKQMAHNNFFVALPGLNMMITTSMNYSEYVEHLINKIDEGHPLKFEPTNGNTIVFFPSSQAPFHLMVLTEEEFKKMQREQAVMQARQQGQGLVIGKG